MVGVARVGSVIVYATEETTEFLYPALTAIALTVVVAARAIGPVYGAEAVVGVVPLVV